MTSSAHSVGKQFGLEYHERRANPSFTIRSSIYRKELFQNSSSKPPTSLYRPSMELQQRPRVTTKLKPLHTKNEENKDGDKSFKKLVHTFMGYTTAHGIGRLGDAKNIFWKLFWTLVCMGAFGMFIFQVMGLFQLFLSRPVSTSVKITFEKKLSFPAVTLCNLNMLRKDAVPEDIKEALKEKIQYDVYWSSSTNINGSDDGGSRRRRRETGSGGNSDYATEDDSGGYGEYSDYQYDANGDENYGSEEGEEEEEIDEEYPDAENIDAETRLRIEISQLVGESNPDELYFTGHMFHTMVENCTWKGLDCRAGNLSKYWSLSWNYKYGNCYTFNSGYDEDNKAKRVLTSSKPGPSQGLTLKINIEQNNYIGPLSIEAGVRLLLHEQGEMPFPYEEGFSVSPNVATSVGIKKTSIVRLDRFNNNSCLVTNELEMTNIYRRFRNISVYSQQACLNSCLGSSQYAICKCSEIAYPSNKEPCDVFNSTTARCLKFVKHLFNDDKLKCLDDCRQPCTEEVIQKTISASQWPSESYKAYQVSKGQSKNQTNSLLLLNVFFNELNYEKIEEEFSYGFINLLADIGGQLGLWIGISVLTCCELLELFMKMLVHLVKKCDKLNDVEEVPLPGYS